AAVPQIKQVSSPGCLGLGDSIRRSRYGGGDHGHSLRKFISALSSVSCEPGWLAIWMTVMNMRRLEVSVGMHLVYMAAIAAVMAIDEASCAVVSRFRHKREEPRIFCGTTMTSPGLSFVESTLPSSHPPEW